MNPNSQSRHIADLHCDTVGALMAGEDFYNRDGHVNIEKLRRGRVALQVFACFIPGVIPEKDAFEQVENMLAFLNEQVEQFSDQLFRVEKVFDFIKKNRQDKTGVMLAVENGHAIASSLENIERLRLQGARYMTLTHSSHLPWAASSGDQRSTAMGLSAFGREVVREMNRCEMIVDVSHVHENTFRDAVKVSKKPLIASHSNAAELCPSARNLSDEQIRAIAGSGGMIGINFFPGFLDAEYYNSMIDRCGELFPKFDEIEKKYMHEATRRLKAHAEFEYELRQRMRDRFVPLRSIINHILYIVELVGDDHVGFGSDFDGIPDLPRGVGGCDVYPQLVRELRKAGLSEESVRKIESENFLRVLKDNEG